jgi:hypothetical protein
LTATATNSDKLLCVDVGLAKAATEVAPVKPVALVEPQLTESSTGGTLKITWKDCGDASTHGKVSALEPKTISIGGSSTLTGTGALDKDEAGGSFVLNAKFGIIKEKYTGDVCSPKTFNLPLGLGHVDWKGMKCPLAKGDVSVQIGTTLAGSIPASLASGTISLTATATNSDKLLCVDVGLAKAATEIVV